MSRTNKNFTLRCTIFKILNIYFHKYSNNNEYEYSNNNNEIRHKIHASIKLSTFQLYAINSLTQAHSKNINILGCNQLVSNIV
jgi:hypothetical protein